MKRLVFVILVGLALGACEMQTEAPSQVKTEAEAAVEQEPSPPSWELTNLQQQKNNLTHKKRMLEYEAKSKRLQNARSEDLEAALEELALLQAEQEEILRFLQEKAKVERALIDLKETDPVVKAAFRQWQIDGNEGKLDATMMEHEGFMALRNTQRELIWWEAREAWFAPFEED